MAPVTQYVFAEMLGISEHFTAGSHEWLPYSVIPTFLKLICKQQFAVQLMKADNLNPNLRTFYILTKFSLQIGGFYGIIANTEYHSQCGMEGGLKWRP